jgi:hypothetical protein
MSVKVVKNEERTIDDAHRIAELLRRALAETKDLLRHADDADHEARRAAESVGQAPEKPGKTPSR